MEVLANLTTSSQNIISPLFSFPSVYFIVLMRGKQYERERKLRNDKYDEAVDVSQSMDQGAGAAPKGARASGGDDVKSGGRGMTKGTEQTKSQSVLNKPFDEALEFSQSGSDDSVDTRTSDKKGNKKDYSEAKGGSRDRDASQGTGQSSSIGGIQGMAGKSSETSSSGAGLASSASMGKAPSPKRADPAADEDSGDGDDGDNGEESYDNIEGAYKPQDYEGLNVSAEVRELFQYIERYKPQEVELETTLKCFIPEYIPAIGEMDAFIKVKIIEIILHPVLPYSHACMPPLFDAVPTSALFVTSCPTYSSPLTISVIGMIVSI